METTFKKNVKGSTMEHIFDNSTPNMMIKFYKNLKVLSEKEHFNENQMYQYEITVRHSEETNGEELFNAEVNRIEQLAKPGKSKSMKRSAIIQTITLLLISINCISQPFAGDNFTQRGIGLNTGFLFDNTIEVTANFKTFRNGNEEPKIISLSAGYKYLFTRNELNNWSVTPSIGFANYRVKDFKAYDADPTGKTGIMQINEGHPIIGINFSKDIFMGQLFLSADYCNKLMYYGTGIRFYFYRKLIVQD